MIITLLLGIFCIIFYYLLFYYYIHFINSVLYFKIKNHYEKYATICIMYNQFMYFLFSLYLQRLILKIDYILIDSYFIWFILFIYLFSGLMLFIPGNLKNKIPPFLSLVLHYLLFFSSISGLFSIYFINLGLDNSFSFKWIHFQILFPVEYRINFLSRLGIFFEVAIPLDLFDFIMSHSVTPLDISLLFCYFFIEKSTLCFFYYNLIIASFYFKICLLVLYLLFIEFYFFNLINKFTVWYFVFQKSKNKILFLKDTVFVLWFYYCFRVYLTTLLVITFTCLYFFFPISYY